MPIQVWSDYDCTLLQALTGSPLTRLTPVEMAENTIYTVLSSHLKVGRGMLEVSDLKGGELA